MSKENTEKCRKCQAVNLLEKLVENNHICPNCGCYLQFPAMNRLKSLADNGSFEEWKATIEYTNPFADDKYRSQLRETQKKYNMKDAIIIGKMKINNRAVAVGVMDTRFLMASLGYLVGEKVTLLFEIATKKKLPVIIFCCSGGARMQEGIISLMQMEKIAAAVVRHSLAGLLYISILTNPTMGGVSASYAMLADIVLAEEGAMVGFAGARVIEQNIGIKFSKEFQTAEFQKEHGFIDAIVSRNDIKNYFAAILELHKKKYKYNKRFKKIVQQKTVSFNISRTIWERIQIARAINRPTSIQYINLLFDVFIEFCGDRVMGDDHSIVAGLAMFHGLPVTVIAQQKGKNSIEQAKYYNWGMSSPPGYRKALRLMKQAEKFDRPVICLIDTIGAACGKEAEEQGQSVVIANLLREMSVLMVPILSIIISEGNSGGALALGVGNEVWMLENAVYSVISPEGYASIMWKDNSRAAEASERMKMGADELFENGIIDKIIAEEEPVTADNMQKVCKELDIEIQAFIRKYSRKTKKDIIQERYLRFRKF